MDKETFEYNPAHVFGFLLEDAGLDIDWSRLDEMADYLNELVDKPTDGH